MVGETDPATRFDGRETGSSFVLNWSSPAIMASRPKSKSGQLADLMRTRIESGEWATGIPPERVLAEEYFVSRSTVRGALTILEEAGLLDACSSTRSGRAVRGGGQVLPVTHASMVVVLTPSLGDSPFLLEQVAVLRELLGRSGIQVMVREVARLCTLSRPQTALRRLVDAHPHSTWILHKMPRQVQLAASSLGLPSLIFGSAYEGVELPSIDVDFRAVARHAAGRCFARGLHRLSVIVHRTPLAGDELIVEALAADLAQRGAPPLHVMKHDFNRTRLMDALDRLVASPAGMPDALLVVNQHHLLTALPHLLRRGIEIPRDLSVIFLSNDPAVERLSPLPDRYDLGDRLLRRLAAAIQTRQAGEIPVSSLLLPKMLRGETLR